MVFIGLVTKRTLVLWLNRKGVAQRADEWAGEPLGRAFCVRARAHVHKSVRPFVGAGGRAELYRRDQSWGGSSNRLIKTQHLRTSESRIDAPNMVRPEKQESGCSAFSISTAALNQPSLRPTLIFVHATNIRAHTCCMQLFQPHDLLFR